MYNSYGGLGGSYGVGQYGNNMYRSPYGGQYGGSGMYGGGMYNGGFGGPMGGYGMGMGGPYGNQDPNNPFGEPPSPPGFWISFLNMVRLLCLFNLLSIFCSSYHSVSFVRPSMLWRYNMNYRQSYHPFCLLQATNSNI